MMTKHDVSLRDAHESLARTTEKLENLKEQLSELEQDNYDPGTTELIREFVNALERRISRQEDRLKSLASLAERYEAD